jgi:hypothetical protein
MVESSVKRYYRMDRRKVHHLKFILEGYSGVAVVSTLDPEKGLIELRISPGCEKEVDMIIGDLQKDVRIEPANIAEKEAQ